jgi:hypothetical protein
MPSRSRVASQVGLRLSIVLAAACLDSPAGPEIRRPERSLRVEEENLRPGSPEWDVGLYEGVDSTIAGYGLPFSVSAGDTLHVFVSARHGPGSVSIYRLGWYDGVGARRIDRHVGLPTPAQPPCSAPLPGPSACAWAETDAFVVMPQWSPGLYLAKVSDSLGRASAFPFVVRSHKPAAFNVVLPFATYQAYNAWGGTNLYRGPGATPQDAFATRAVAVSFARPWTVLALRGAILGVDYLLVRWLEQNAYDVDYMTDYDFHVGRGPDPRFGWLFAGHSEYWTWPMWLRANAARDRGTSLGFLGGNDIYWVARYESVPVNRLDVPVLVCYRDASRDPQGSIPGLSTVLFRSPPNNTPENALLGVMSADRSVLRSSPVDLVVKDAAHPLFAGTGLRTGDRIPHVAGWEADRIVQNGATPLGTQVLFEGAFIPMGDTMPTGLMQATVYTWLPSGAVVFASGQPGFAWGLSTYRSFTGRPPLQRFLSNVLDAFVAARSGQ